MQCSTSHLLHVQRPHNVTLLICVTARIDFFFFFSIFSIVIVHMPQTANSEPSEVQQSSAATQLTRLLILETTLLVWSLLRKHTNCYLFPSFDVALWLIILRRSSRPLQTWHVGLRKENMLRGGCDAKAWNKHSLLLFPFQTADHLCVLEEKENTARQWANKSHKHSRAVLHLL